MIQKLVFGIAILLLVAVAFWSSDRITLQGERTIFTVNCDQGTWQGSHCSGKLVAGAQYAFRASHSRHEVVYWVRGSQTPSGKFTDCTVKDRDNWTCNVQLDQAPALTFEMIKGKPTRGSAGLALPFHCISKWKWWVLNLGIPAFKDANE